MFLPGLPLFPLLPLRLPKQGLKGNGGSTVTGSGAGGSGTRDMGTLRTFPRPSLGSAPGRTFCGFCTGPGVFPRHAAFPISQSGDPEIWGAQPPVLRGDRHRRGRVSNPGTRCSRASTAPWRALRRRKALSRGDDVRAAPGDGAGRAAGMAQLGAIAALSLSFLAAAFLSAIHKIEEGHIGVYYR